VPRETAENFGREVEVSQLTIPTEWWTADYAGQVLGVGAPQVRALCRRGVLVGRLVQRRWLVEPTSVRRRLVVMGARGIRVKGRAE
jgi:hypothetical protein